MKKRSLLILFFLTAQWFAANTALAQHEGSHSYKNGICTINGCTDKFEPAIADNDGWYQLGNVGNVEWFSAQIAAAHNTYKGKLTADIDFEGLGDNFHTPIGNYGQKFIGKFDGCGYSIKNMVLINPARPKTDGSDGYGFFGCVRLGGGNGANLVEIKNLTIESSCSVSADKNYVGGLVGRISENTDKCTVRIENCINKANVTSSTNGNTGGLVGQINNTGGTSRTIEIINCENQGVITAKTNNASGLVGQINGAVTVNINNCVNSGSVSSNNYAAGILAQINADAIVSISRCVNSGNITTILLAASGIASQINNKAASLTIESCMNLGSISCNGNQENSKNAGSIFGANTSSNGNSKIIIRNCGNRGSVSGRTENAALVGWIGGNTGKGHKIENCWNTGEVTGISPTNNTMYRGSATVSNIYNTQSNQQGTLITEGKVSSGELCYLLNGDQSVITWFQNLTGSTDAYPVLSSVGHAQVFQNAVYQCPNVTTGDVSYSNTNSSVIPPHDYEDGVCSFCKKYEPATLDVDYYQIDNYGKLKWFENEVNNGHPEYNANLLTNLDFKGTFCRIGNATYPYSGVFKGNDNIVSNFTINNEQMVQGFFGFVTGGADISGLVFDKTCSISCVAKAGIVGSTKGSGTVKLTRLGNEGSVTVTNENAAGIIGTDENSTAVLLIDQCYSTGVITGGKESAQIAGWTGSNSTITNSWSCSEVSGFDANRHFSRYGGSGDTQYRNCYTVYNDNTKGLFYNVEGFGNGLVAVMLNHVAGKTVCYQNLTGSKDNYPVLDSSHAQVYGHDVNVYCDNTYASGGTFDNTAPGSFNQLGHEYNGMGICIHDCEGITHFQEPQKDGDYYLLANAGNVEWLSNAVKGAGGAAFYAKLTQDIDFLNIENLHNPIGPTTGSKFKGVFDGQGYRIKNMIINRPTSEAQGFFGWLQGNDNTTIKNLIIDKSCSIIGSNKSGGVAGASQNYKAGATITIENVVNEANVTVSGQDAAGIVGGESGDKANYYIHNVVNTGNITSTHQDPFVGALFCYQEKGSVENFLNLGTITGHKGGNMGRFQGTWKNVIDLSDTNMDGTDSGENRGIREDLTKADLTNGKVAYILGFKQLISSSEYPSPLNDSEVLYVGAAGYTTLYDADNDWELNGDAQAYIGSLNGNYLHLSEIDDVPAGTAVIIGGTYYNKVSTTATANATGNSLLGSDGTVTGGSGIYALANKSKGVGFYPVSNSVTIPAGKVYLQVAGNAVREFYPFGGEETTSLNEELRVKSEEFATAMYDLSGRKVNSKFKDQNSKLKNGIYIQNSKKVLF